MPPSSTRCSAPGPTRPCAGGLASFSFPSGHTAGATVLYGAAVVWLWPRLASAGARAALLLAAAGVVLLVAASRVARGMHFPSDCAAAMLEGPSGSPSAWRASPAQRGPRRHPDSHDPEDCLHPQLPFRKRQGRQRQRKGKGGGRRRLAGHAPRGDRGRRRRRPGQRGRGRRADPRRSRAGARARLPTPSSPAAATARSTRSPRCSSAGTSPSACCRSARSTTSPRTSASRSTSTRRWRRSPPGTPSRSTSARSAGATSSTIRASASTSTSCATASSSSSASAAASGRAFAWAAWGALRRWPVLTVALSVDGRRACCRTPFVFVGNNVYRMEGFHIGERDSLCDGVLSVYVAGRAGRWPLFVLGLRALVGRLRQAKDFRAFAATELRIETPRPEVRIATDGEVCRLPHAAALPHPSARPARHRAAPRRRPEPGPPPCAPSCICRTCISAASTRRCSTRWRGRWPRSRPTWWSCRAT